MCNIVVRVGRESLIVWVPVMAPRPLGVSILGFLLLLLGAGFLVLALLVVMPTSLGNGGLTYFAGVSASSLLEGPESMIMVEGALGSGFLSVLLGLGIWMGSNPARLILMLLLVLQSLVSLLSIASDPLIAAMVGLVGVAAVAYLHMPNAHLYFTSPRQVRPRERERHTGKAPPPSPGLFDG